MLCQIKLSFIVHTDHRLEIDSRFERSLFDRKIFHRSGSCCVELFEFLSLFCEWVVAVKVKNSVCVVERNSGSVLLYVISLTFKLFHFYLTYRSGPNSKHVNCLFVFNNFCVVRFFIYLFFFFCTRSYWIWIFLNILIWPIDMTATYY